MRPNARHTLRVIFSGETALFGISSSHCADAPKQQATMPVSLVIHILVNVAGSASMTVKMTLACAFQGLKQFGGSRLVLQAAAPMLESISLTCTLCDCQIHESTWVGFPRRKNFRLFCPDDQRQPEKMTEMS